MSGHRHLSGSSAHRWIKCPGSIRLNKQIGRDETQSGAAREGTIAHAFAAEALLYFIAKGKLPKRYKPNMQIVIDGNREVLKPEMHEHVDIYIQQAIVRSKLGQPYVEKKLSLSNLVRDNMEGTADYLVDGARTLFVTDFKYGYTPVRIEHNGEINAQLMYYAAGALDLFEWKHKEAVLEIVQPRSMEVDTIQEVIMPAEQIKDWATNTLWEAAHKTDEPDAPLVPGDHCRFCNAQSICPALREQVQLLAGDDFQSLQTPTSQAVLPLPEEPEKIAKILQWAPMIDSWLRSAEEQAQTLLERAIPVPGFKLVKKRANRQWPTDDIIKLAKLLKTKPNKLIETSIKSPAQMEKLIGKAAVNALAIKPDTGLTVAAESDRRPAVESPESDFKELL